MMAVTVLCYTVLSVVLLFLPGGNAGKNLASCVSETTLKEYL